MEVYKNISIDYLLYGWELKHVPSIAIQSLFNILIYLHIFVLDFISEESNTKYGIG